MSGTAAQLKIEVGLSAGRVGRGKTKFDKSIKNSSQKKNGVREFLIDLIVQSEVAQWPSDAHNIRLASHRAKP